MICRAAALVLLAAWMTPVVQAQPISAGDAAALETQLRDFFVNLIGPAQPLPAPPIQVTADGAGYRITLPIQIPDVVPEGRVNLSARPLGGSRWAVDGLQVPPALSAPPIFNYSLGELKVTGTVDLDFATASSMAWDLRNLMYTVQTNGEAQTQVIGRYTVSTTLTPSGGNQLDLHQTGTMENWRSKATLKDGSAVDVTIRQIKGESAINGIGTGALGQIVTVVRQVATGAMTDGLGEVTDAQRTALRSLIESIRNAFASISSNETFDDVHFALGNLGDARIRQTRIGFGGQAPGGKLRTWLDFAVEGISSPALPPELARFIPSRVELRPVVEGVPMDGLKDLALAAIEPDADSAMLTANLMALFAADNVTLGLENLRIDVAPLQLEGNGRFRMLAAGQPGVEAHLSAAGVDALMEQAKTDPLLQQAQPVLLMLRGLGRQDAGRIVWDISAREGQVMVNGVDVTALAGGKPAAKQPAQKPPAKR
jgi:Uncharacterized protein conserved in bacteria (DUF2125)